MDNYSFSIFPNDHFLDLTLYQYGWEQCAPLYSYGPSVRNHYLFHFIISGRGQLRSNDADGVTHHHRLGPGQGFLICPGHPEATSLHLIGQLCLFLDDLVQSSSTRRETRGGPLRDFYIQEAVTYIKQNYQRPLTVEEIAGVCKIGRAHV